MLRHEPLPETHFDLDYNENEAMEYKATLDQQLRASAYYVENKEDEKAIASYTAAIQIARKLQNELATEADCYKNIGYIYLDHHHHKTARNYFKKAARCYQAEELSLHEADKYLALTSALICKTYAYESNLEKAFDYAIQSFNFSGHGYGIFSEKTASTLNSLSLLCNIMKFYKLEQACLKGAHAIYQHITLSPEIQASSDRVSSILEEISPGSTYANRIEQDKVAGKLTRLSAHLTQQLKELPKQTSTPSPRRLPDTFDMTFPELKLPSTENNFEPPLTGIHAMIRSLNLNSQKETKLPQPSALNENVSTPETSATLKPDSDSQLTPVSDPRSTVLPEKLQPIESQDANFQSRSSALPSATASSLRNNSVFRKAPTFASSILPSIEKEAIGEHQTTQPSNQDSITSKMKKLMGMR